jgi:predicted dehydrogenase
VAAGLKIPKTFGSYEALLNCAEIDAVYIPLPNHLHVPWSITDIVEINEHFILQ